MFIINSIFYQNCFKVRHCMIVVSLTTKPNASVTFHIGPMHSHTKPLRMIKLVGVTNHEMWRLMKL